MKTIQEQIAVMQHFANGGEVECVNIFYTNTAYIRTTKPVWDWECFDYRIKQPVDPYAELKAAAADPTKQIRCKYLGDWCEWHDATYGWKWCYPPEYYEIRDKPKPVKKVKLLAWFDGCALFWRTENFTYEASKRVQSEDKVIEVEECSQ